MTSKQGNKTNQYSQADMKFQNAASSLMGMSGTTASAPMSPDYFLSRNRIRYDGLGLQGTPAEIVQSLQVINNLRYWDSDIFALIEKVYETAGFTPSPVTGNSFSPVLINRESKAMQAYFAALQTGSLNAVHAAVDAINAVRSQKGGTMFVPLSDFQIICHGNDIIAVNARHLVSERESVLETGFGSYAGSPLPWFDTFEGFSTLNSYNS